MSETPPPPWPPGDDNPKREGWKAFFAGKAREACPFPRAYPSLHRDFEIGWDAAKEAVVPSSRPLGQRLAEELWGKEGAEAYFKLLDAAYKFAHRSGALPGSEVMKHAYEQAQRLTEAELNYREPGNDQAQG